MLVVHLDNPNHQAYYKYGYAIQENIQSEISHGMPIYYANPFSRITGYLNDKKKPLDKNIFVWMSKQALN